MSAGLFHPQFHGREHINALRWMNALRNNIGNIRMAFDYGMYDLSTSGNIISEDSFMDSFSYNNEREFEFIRKSIIEGTLIFENLFGYRSSSFIATCYIWDSKQESILAEHGIRFIQGGHFSKMSHFGEYKHL